MRIYKIVTEAVWQQALAVKRLEGMPVDLADGYLHFSAPAQLRETAAKHFAGQTGLVLIGVEAEALGAALKWEVSRGGQLFPHLYAALATDQIAFSAPLRQAGDGTHLFPDDIP